MAREKDGEFTSRWTFSKEDRLARTIERGKPIVVRSELSVDVGVRPACLVVFQGHPLSKKYDLEKRSTIIGRSPSCDIQVDEESASRGHCQLINTGDSIVLRDLESTNGTYINDSPVEERALRDGDLLKIGRTVFKFLTGGNIEQAYHEDFHRQNTFDDLTQVYNKRCLIEALGRETIRSYRCGHDLSLVMFDFDHFRHVNDRFGHLTGDHVLKQLAQLVADSVRSEHTIGRYGGGTFAIVLPEVDLWQAKEKAEELRQIVEGKAFEFEGEQIPVTITLGVVGGGPGTSSSEQMVRLAERALARGKQEGRNRTCALGSSTEEFSIPEVAAIPRAKSASPAPIPLLWLRREVTRRLATAERNVVLVAWAVADRLAIHADFGRQTLSAVEARLYASLRDLAGDGSVALDDGRFFCLMEREPSEAEIAEVRRLVNAELHTAVGLEAANARSAVVRVCCGSAAVSQGASVDDCFDEAVRQMGLNAKQASEALLQRLPFPVARSIRLVQTADHPEAQAQRIAHGMERILQFLAHICMSTVLEGRLPDSLGEHVAKVLSGRALSGGSYLELVQHVCKVASEQDWPVVSTLARQLFSAESKEVELPKAARPLIEERNRLSHGRSSDLATFPRLFDDLVASISCLAAYRLCTLTGFRSRRGVPIWRLRDHTGPDQLFCVDECPMPSSPLVDTGVTYLLSRETGDYVALSPLLLLGDRRPDGTRELLWTSHLQLEERTDYVGMFSGLNVRRHVPDYAELPEILKRKRRQREEQVTQQIRISDLDFDEGAG